MSACERLCGAPADVEVPDGEGALRVCWSCASAFVEGGEELGPLDPDKEAARRAAIRAFELAVRPCMKYLRAAALRLTKHAADADDVVQDALIKAMVAWPRFEDRGNGHTRAWLGLIVRRCFIDTVRRRSARPESEYHEAGHHEAWAEYMDAQRAIGNLSENHRAVLELAMLGLPYAEIAEKLSIPPGTVMSRLHRARATIELSLR